MANESSSENANFKFKESQKVYCYHGDIMYEARCIATDVRDNTSLYLVHYHGWSKNWDEWVDESRILEFNEENKKLAQDLKANYSKPKSANKRKILNTSNTPKSASKGGKSRVDSSAVFSDNNDYKDESVNVNSPSSNHFNHKTGGLSTEEDADDEKSQTFNSTVHKIKNRKRRSTLGSQKILNKSLNDNASNLSNSLIYTTDDNDEPELKTPNNNQSASSTSTPRVGRKPNPKNQKRKSTLNTPTAVSKEEKEDNILPNIGDIPIKSKNEDMSDISFKTASVEHATFNDECQKENQIIEINQKSPNKSGSDVSNSISEISSVKSIDNSLKIDIPEELKKIIVDDYIKINKLQMFVKLPAEKTVNQIIDQYVQERIENLKKCSMQTTLAERIRQMSSQIKLKNDPILNKLSFDNLGKLFEESGYYMVPNGILDYFNTFLPNYLLYKQERTQYDEIMEQCSDLKKTNQINETLTGMESNGKSASSALKIRQRRNTSTKLVKSETKVVNGKAKTFNNRNRNKWPKPGSVYGSIHLLRMFCNIDILCSRCNLDEQLYLLLKPFFIDFVDFLNEHRQELFSSSYEQCTITSSDTNSSNHHNQNDT